MDTHKNAPLTPKGREATVRSATEGALTKAAAALQFNVSAKTVAKWVKRFREEGVDGLRDRSSRPLSSFIAKPNPCSHILRDRGIAPAAPHRQADRNRGRHLASDRQPYPAAAGIEPIARFGARLCVGGRDE
ncbi:transposase-like protein [Bradyrhizobium yuanmingense]|uniref:leucine zipper domain-containing protein n=1 Tax=Bradyrhizobium yuanmingense TaxID=108015 RepID=UPI0035141B40